MSFLAPLFALGAIAVAAPIILHLIRRTTREKFRFSSIMFLQPTPPRMTRQSRLENIFLLLLRCLVLCLLALGFARPFIQKPMAADPGSNAGQRMAVLIDVSASMRQSGLWSAAREKAASIIRAAKPGDSVALFAFDRTARSLVSFEQWANVSSGDRVALALQRLAETSPGWNSTHLGNALITAVEAVEETAGRDPGKPVAARRKVVVITDLQEGARLDGLQGFEWPRGLEVDLQTVRPGKVTNAGLSLVGEAAEAERNLTDTDVKVRVNNASSSRREQFQVGWIKSGETAFVGKPVDVYVPPGQSRVASIPFPDNHRSLETLRLTGDEEEFDNVVYHVPPKAEQIRLLFLGDDNPTDHTQALYYINRAFQETRRLKVDVLARSGNAILSPAEAASASLMIASGSLAPEGIKTAREFLESGRTVLFALNEVAAGKTLAELLGLGTLDVQEAPGGRDYYALLGQIDFQHPIFAPFADPRFSDFTKIHFWRHRILDPAAIKNARVLARFDKGGPAMLEVPVGKGALFVLTTTWRPGDSQLALSSKFVPILFSMLELGGAIKAQLSQYAVGDTLSLTSTNAGQAATIRKPDGKEATLAAGQRYAATDQPGVYIGTVGTGGSDTVRFAVNLDPTESRTVPLPVEELERLGIPLKPPEVNAQKEAEKKERLHAAELEQRQKLWRWLLVGALLFLILETAVAGRLTNRPAPA